MNRVYYDFFFEGFLNKILTVYLPVLIMAAYVNEAFRPDVLMEKFGQTHILRYSGFLGGDPMSLGAVFWFVLYPDKHLSGMVCAFKNHWPEKNRRPPQFSPKPTSDQA